MRQIPFQSFLASILKISQAKSWPEKNPRHFRRAVRGLSTDHPCEKDERILMKWPKTQGWFIFDTTDVCFGGKFPVLVVAGYFPPLAQGWSAECFERSYLAKLTRFHSCFFFNVHLATLGEHEPILGGTWTYIFWEDTSFTNEWQERWPTLPGCLFQKLILIIYQPIRRGTYFLGHRPHPIAPTNSLLLGGGFKHCFIFIPTWGDDPIWRAYFLDGLKPPTN